MPWLGLNRHDRSFATSLHLIFSHQIRRIGSDYQSSGSVRNSLNRTRSRPTPIPPKYRPRQHGGGGYRGSKLGHGPDSTRIQITKRLDRIFGVDSESTAKNEGLQLRHGDGYAKVGDLLGLPGFYDVDFRMLEEVVRQDTRQRYHLYCDKEGMGGAPNTFWIGANPRTHLKVRPLLVLLIFGLTQLQPSHIDLRKLVWPFCPTLALHGTSEEAWKSICRTTSVVLEID